MTNEYAKLSAQRITEEAVRLMKEACSPYVGQPVNQTKQSVADAMARHLQKFFSDDWKIEVAEDGMGTFTYLKPVTVTTATLDMRHVLNNNFFLDKMKEETAYD
ncbi:hypothetical protein_gp278 [Bacillus phage vB_BceM_WH1]|nr:hypothetical protein_gp278 [Bacillus phage vB_BceM_WH1]